MSEYPIHTDPIDRRENFKHFLHHLAVPVILALAGVTVAIISNPDDLAYARAVENARSTLASETISPTIVPTQTYPDQLEALSKAVTGLLENGWMVQDLAMDGTVRIVGKGLEMECGVLDDTPADETDNQFAQFPDLESLAFRLGVIDPSQTFLIWGDNVGILPESNGSAASVDTDEVVWACPKVVIVGE